MSLILVIRRLLPLLILLLLPVQAFCQASQPGQTILIVHSYHQGMQWVEEVHQALEETLLTAKGNTLDIRVEYMDSKRYSASEYNQLQLSNWRYKYADQQLDCLIVCDDNALNLVLSVREELFQNVPIVFCGINHYDPYRFAGVNNITGVVEAYDLEGTLELIQTLFPQRNNLFIINDDTLTGQANRMRLEEIAYQFHPRLTFTYSGLLPIATMQEVVSNLGEDTAILLMSYNRDRDGRAFRYRDAISAIREAANVPIFGVWSFYLGRGIVGGSLVNGRSQGSKAGELALQILGGKQTADVPVIRQSPNLPMFDHAELRRFSLSPTLLPEGSVVINSPPLPLWQEHGSKLLLVAALLLAQLCIIALLFHNIRKRRSTEEHLRKSRQNLEITLEAIGEAVLSLDYRGRISMANHAAVELLELPASAASGLDLQEYFNQGGEESLLARLVGECLASGQKVNLGTETSHRRQDGKLRYLSGSCSPIRNGRNRLQGAVLVLHDITEQINTRAMLHQSRKMEAIGQLAGGVAHDFNNILTGISGFSELLTMQLPPNSPQLESARRIRLAANRASDLTSKLLSFARKGKVLSSPVDCHRAINAALDLFRHSLHKDIQLTTSLDAEQAVIIGDPSQLESVFLNLLINSADAMAEGGSLQITTAIIHPAEPLTCEFGEPLDPGSYLQVRVKDTGSGISPEIREKIFEPFFTTKPQGKGTGLGLSAVFGAMKEHGGRIVLNSAIGLGTEFQLYFPLAKTSDVTPPTSHPAVSGSGFSILVIDDEQLILAMTDNLLSEMGYRVFTALGAQQGIETYRRHWQEIDAVVLDMIMPEMDGTACLAQLQQINPKAAVIISSGFSKTATYEAASRQGARGFLQKPYSAEEFNRAISGLLADQHK